MKNKKVFFDDIDKFLLETMPERELDDDITIQKAKKIWKIIKNYLRKPSLQEKKRPKLPKTLKLVPIGQRSFLME